MRNYCILNGNDSRAINGLLISELPPIVKPQIRTEIDEIDGKDGDSVTYLGYSAVDKEMTIGLYGNYDLNRIIAFFDSEGVVTFSNESDKYYFYKIIERIDYERLAHFRTAIVTFHCQPFKFSLAETPRELVAARPLGVGESVTLTPTAQGDRLTKFSLRGVCNQDGTPTINNSVPIQTVTGAYTINLTNSAITNSYPLNLGADELCIVGNYQDSIFRNAGKWYKNNAIGRMTINVDDIVVSAGENWTEIKIPKPDDALCYDSVVSVPCLCTNALFSAAPETWDDSVIGHIYSDRYTDYFFMGAPAGMTESDVKTALTGALIYYPKMWRLDVEIENATLKNNLETIYNAPLLAKKTVISSSAATGETPIIDVAAISATFEIVNIGNVYSKPKITVFGAGNIVLTVNGVDLFVIYLGTEQKITIDAAEMDAYNDNGLKNRLVLGDYDKFKLNTGNNIISCSGNIQKIIIENYSRWI